MQVLRTIGTLLSVGLPCAYQLILATGQAQSHGLPQIVQRAALAPVNTRLFLDLLTLPRLLQLAHNPAGFGLQRCFDLGHANPARRRDIQTVRADGKADATAG